MMPIVTRYQRGFFRYYKSSTVNSKKFGTYLFTWVGKESQQPYQPYNYRSITVKTASS